MQTIYTPLRAKNHGRLVNQKGCFLSCLMRITTILFCFHFLVSFWQPLTQLPEKKCKRCGLYEEDTFKHDLYDEWELCSSDFKKGKYTHFKEGQFNATFLCPNCTASAGTAHIQCLCFSLLRYFSFINSLSWLDPQLLFCHMPF